MYGKKLSMIGMCMFMITASIVLVIGNEEDTKNTTPEINTTLEINETTNEGTWYDDGCWYPFTIIGRINYTEGNAVGTFVHFTINENTGMISNYTITLPPNWTCSFNPQNTTIFSSITVKDFKQACPPNPFSVYLTYQGKNTLMNFYDCNYAKDFVRIDFASSDKNTTIIFTIPDGLSINTPPENPSWMSWRPPDIEIKSNVTYTFMEISDGNFTIHGQTIEVNLNPYGTLEVFSSFTWPTLS